MPDSNLADGAVLTSSFYNTYIREQVVVTCTSSTRPTGIEGRLIFETDTNQLRVHDGTSWNIVSGSAWVTYTPSWTNLTLGNGTQNASYMYTPAGVTVRGSLTFGSTTSISGSVSQTVPNGESLSAGGSGLGMVFASNGTNEYDGVIRVSSTVATFYANNNNITSTNPITWATGHILAWNYLCPL